MCVIKKGKEMNISINKINTAPVTLYIEDTLFNNTDALSANYELMNVVTKHFDTFNNTKLKGVIILNIVLKITASEESNFDFSINNDFYNRIITNCINFTEDATTERGVYVPSISVEIYKTDNKTPSLIINKDTVEYVEVSAKSLVNYKDKVDKNVNDDLSKKINVNVPNIPQMTRLKKFLEEDYKTLLIEYLDILNRNLIDVPHYHSYASEDNLYVLNSMERISYFQDISPVISILLENADLSRTVYLKMDISMAYKYFPNSKAHIEVIDNGIDHVNEYLNEIKDIFKDKVLAYVIKEKIELKNAIDFTILLTEKNKLFK